MRSALQRGAPFQSRCTPGCSTPGSAGASRISSSASATTCATLVDVAATALVALQMPRQCYDPDGLLRGYRWLDRNNGGGIIEYRYAIFALGGTMLGAGVTRTRHSQMLHNPFPYVGWQ